MAESNRIIGIELGLFEEVVRTVVRQEMAEVREEIKQTIISKRETLLQEERLYINQVAQLLGVTRHTVNNYTKKGDLPEPKRDISGRPYWTPQQLEHTLILKGVKTRFPV